MPLSDNENPQKGLNASRREEHTSNADNLLIAFVRFLARRAANHDFKVICDRENEQAIDDEKP